MKATTKQVLIVASWLAVLLAVIGGTMMWQRQVRHRKHNIAAVTVTSTARIPNVLILDRHTTDREGRQLVAGMQRNNGYQSVVTVTVTANGRLNFNGEFRAHDNRPYLRIVLPNQTASEQKEALWIKMAIKYSQSHLHFKTFNLISYGSGGISATNYLEHTTNDVLPAHFVAIATPFNGTSTAKSADKTTAVTKANQTLLLRSLTNQRQKIAKRVQVLLIAGKSKQHQNGDGVIPIQSALAGQAIFKGHVSRYQQKVLNSWRATHKGILSSFRLTNMIQDFIS